ncbi:MAG: excinuclease ABC subunit UvrA [Vicingaceae bacterium]
MSEWLDQVVMSAEKSSLSIHKAYASLNQQEKELLWNGNNHFKGILDFFNYVEQKSYKIQYRVMLSRYRGKTLCPDCSGTRLREDVRFIKVGGKSINELVIMPIGELFIFIENLKLSELEEKISKRIMHELKFRLSYMLDVGLGYLDLNRPSNTLSGGESQRIQLATSLGSSLVGSMYILDEPSVGLHPRDTLRLIKVLRNLNNLGNTLIVVEHDEDIIAEADEIVDLGPEAGTNGGHIVFQGDQRQLLEANTLTSDYLNGTREIPIPPRRKKWRNFLEIIDAYENNLKNVNVKIPLGILTCITGVSGSGKSSLIRDVLYKSLNNKIQNNTWGSGKYEKIGGNTESITQIEFIDQNPIGKSSRSNPVTYLKAYDEIRALFSNLPQAKLKGLKPSDFSFNVDGGRCDTCKGEGEITVEMQFMSDIRLVCDECHGKRFKEEILEVQFEDHNISDILALTVDQAMEFFAGAEKSKIQSQKITDKLNPLQEVGLGYIHLGQSSSTLSGGEAQRVKLAFFLSKKNQNDHILFLFDEPSTGLHFHDINKLLISLNALVNRGHSVIVIEHHLDIIKSADWVIDLGPEGGLEGGYIVFEGTPEDLLGSEISYTGKYLGAKFKDRAVPRV